MKSLVLLSLLVSAATATGAEPWICTADGTRLIYEESVGGSATGTLDKLVTRGGNGEIRLTYTREGMPVVERWTVYPDSTVLHIEAPEPMYELLRTMQVENIELATRNQSLPATMTPGDEFPGFGFTLSGWKEGERSTVSVVSDRVRVVGRERIKTPAGKFEAVRIEYRTTTTMGDSSVESSMTQWLVPGIGVVRQEIPLFGDMAGVTELQKIIQ